MKVKRLEAAEQPLLVILGPGDEVTASLLAFARDQRIPSASLQGIGALSTVTFAYWNRETRAYEEIVVDEQVEVLSLNGNLARMNGEPRLHAHIVIGRRDGSTAGGHLVRGTVLPTLEVAVNPWTTPLRRSEDPETKLFLLDLSL
jgi:predicted DNA-binding protein with PD1-like motif